MGSIILFLLTLKLLMGSILVTSEHSPKSSQMIRTSKAGDILRPTNSTIDGNNNATTSIHSIENNNAESDLKSDEVRFSANKTINFNKTYQEKINKNDTILKILDDYFNKENSSNISSENKLDFIVLNKNKYEDKIQINNGNNNNNSTHLREERSDFSYDYDQDRVSDKIVINENDETIKNSQNSISDILIRHENSEERIRTFNSVHKNGLKILSHTTLKSENESSGAVKYKNNINNLEIENYVLSKNNNETMKSLGSIDLIVPSLEGMRLPPGRFGDHNFSRIDAFKSSSRSNRTNLHSVGRTDAPMLNYIFDTYSTLNKHHHRNDRFGGPKIETPGSTVKVDTEEDAILECKVTSLQDKLVSWLRRRPDHETPEILTIGQQAYTADTRISVDFLVPNTWRLILKKAVPSDSGVYECQLSTHPPIISRHELIVHAPVIEIVEADGDKYYERNSTLELGCRVRHISTTAIIWYHQSRNLNDDIIRGGINVKTEAVSSGADSLLQVARLTASDGGRYTCSIRDGLQASINVHVLNGESLAELQQTAGTSRASPSLVFLSILFIFFIFVHTQESTLQKHKELTSGRIVKNSSRHRSEHKYGLSNGQLILSNFNYHLSNLLQLNNTLGHLGFIMITILPFLIPLLILIQFVALNCMTINLETLSSFPSTALQLISLR